jgi:hypothetical protein
MLLLHLHVHKKKEAAKEKEEKLGDGTYLVEGIRKHKILV